MTKQEMIRDLLMAHVYSAFDNPRDAWGEVAEEYLQKKAGDITKEDQDLQNELEKVHLELYESEGYGLMEEMVDKLVDKLAGVEDGPFLIP